MYYFLFAGDICLLGLLDGPMFFSKILLILRNFYFVTSRLGPNALSSYNFVYLASVDILSSYPLQAERFIAEIVPAQGINNSNGLGGKLTEVQCS